LKVEPSKTHQELAGRGGVGRVGDAGADAGRVVEEGAAGALEPSVLRLAHARARPVVPKVTLLSARQTLKAVEASGKGTYVVPG
jgi:hypothetical protein